MFRGAESVFRNVLVPLTGQYENMLLRDALLVQLVRGAPGDGALHQQRARPRPSCQGGRTVFDGNKGRVILYFNDDDDDDNSPKILLRDASLACLPSAMSV